MRRSQSCRTVSVTSPARNPGTSSTGAPSPCGTSCPRQVSLTQQPRQLEVHPRLAERAAPPAQRGRELGHVSDPM